MSQNFFITGMPKAGKTTILHRIVHELIKHGVHVGGFITPDEKIHGTRTGFYVMDLESGRIDALANTKADGPKVGKYHVDIKSFEDISLSSMKKIGKYDIYIIDEIGPMELKSKKFAQMLDDALESTVPVVASLSAEFIETYSAQGEVLEIRESNREVEYEELMNKIKAVLAQPKPKPEIVQHFEKGKMKKELAKPKQVSKPIVTPKPMVKQTSKPMTKKELAKMKSSQKSGKTKPSKEEKTKKKAGFVNKIIDLFRL